MIILGSLTSDGGTRPTTRAAPYVSAERSEADLRGHRNEQFAPPQVVG
jgi:hypothetical protein